MSWELVVNGVLAVLGRDTASDSHPRTEVFSALGQPVLMHGARPARDQVHSSGPWDDPPREWSGVFNCLCIRLLFERIDA